MDSPSSSFSPYNDVPTPTFNPKRITLTIPSLNALKNSKKKHAAKIVELPVQKVPRPVKLKPLREVLAKLIVQIKKKDDYAFFLRPVDAAAVPGYSEVVKSPMDFGTMTAKVERGRYRTLDDFLSDFMLVISNAKSFNPPGTLYHTEASRIEQWGLEHIKKAESQVIAYETDWNIDVVADDEPTPASVAHDVDNNVTDGPLLDLEEGRSQRSPSVLSAPGPVDRSRKGLKMASKKQGYVSESLGPNGQLPGSADGLGAFPPCSEMAALMLKLKLRRKRYRNKKERMKMEKTGPPFASDGSLDYLEMEDPFSVLQSLVPGVPSRPTLTPIFPADALVETVQRAEGDDIPQPQHTDRDQELCKIESPIAISPESFSVLFPSSDAIQSFNAPSGRKSLRHWQVHRNIAKSRPRDEGNDLIEEVPWKKRRLAVTTDYGVFSTLLGQVAAEKNVQGENIRSTLSKLQDIQDHLKNHYFDHEFDEFDGISYSKQALEADEYLREVIYGGIDGYAYIRSLAEFVDGMHSSQLKLKAEVLDTSLHEERGLGMPLADWVQTHVIDPLTGGYHSVLRDATLATRDTTSSEYISIRSHLSSLALTEIAQQQLAELQALTDPAEKIDLVPLLHAPHELFLAETEWAGAVYKKQKEQEREELENEMAKRNAAEFLAFAIESHRKGQLEEDGETTNQPTVLPGRDTREVIEYALDAGASAIEVLHKRVGGGEVTLITRGPTEDGALRQLRLNLLAVAKRAPLEKIARLPSELVPQHIRHIVPTITSEP